MVSDFYPPHRGGAERAVADLSAELSARGHDVSVATLWHEGQPRQGCDGAVRLHRLQGGVQRLPFLFSQAQQRFHPPAPDPALAVALRALLARERPDVVHGHTWMMLSALPLRRAYRFATVATLHDYALLCPKKTLLYEERTPCCHQLSAHCLRCAPQHYGAAKALVTTAGLAASRPAYRGVDAFVAISSYIAEQHVRRGLLPRQRIRTIPNFVRDDVAWGPPGPPLPQLPRDYMLFVGALGRHKGLEVLFDAYARLDSPLPLVLIGSVRPDTPATLPPGVMMLPGLPHGEVIRAMDHCRFLVSPALWPEPFGLVAVEAMARGKAVVASRAGGLLDIVQDGQTGLLVAPGDAEELAQALRTLGGDPALAARMGQRGQARCAAHFSAGTVIESFLELYQDAIARRRASQGGQLS